MHYKLVILSGQSNINGVRPIAGAPVGTFTGNVITGVKVWDGSAIVDFDVTDIGPTGNGHTWVGVGSSSSGNYCWAHLFLRRLAQEGNNVLAVVVTEGGSSLMTRTIANGSHNTDTATLSGTYPTTPRLHEELVDRYNDCITYLGANSHTYDVEAFLWDQGEADASQNYPTRQTDLSAKFAAIRTLTGEASLPIYYCTRPYHTGNLQRNWMDRTDLALAGANTHCIKFWNGVNSDDAHFDDASIADLANSVNAIHFGNSVAPNSGFYCRPSPRVYSRIDDYISVSGINPATYTAHIQAAEDLLAAIDPDDFLAIFPFLGNGTLTNLITPNWGALTASGTNTLDSNGWLPNGTNGQLISNLMLSDRADMVGDWAIDMYCTTDDVASDRTLWSFGTSAGDRARAWLPFSGNARFEIKAGSNVVAASPSGTIGLWTTQLRSGVMSILKDGVSLGTDTFADSFFANNVIRFGVDEPGGNVRWLNKRIIYIAIRKTFASNSAYNTAVQAFKTTTGR